MKWRIQWAVGLMGLALGCQPVQEPAAPTTEPTAGRRLFAPDPRPQYPVPYHRLTTDQIAQTLEHLRQRLDGPIGGVADARPTETTAPVGMSPSLATVSYPWGVVYSGMLAAADATGDKAFADFDAKRFQTMADELAKVDPDDHANKIGPLRRLLNPRSLDDCGAIGAAFECGARYEAGHRSLCRLYQQRTVPAEGWNAGPQKSVSGFDMGR